MKKSSVTTMKGSFEMYKGNITIGMLGKMYGLSDIYTQFCVKSRKDGTTSFAAAGTFRYIVGTYPNWPLVRWSYAVEDGEAFIELIGRG